MKLAEIRELMETFDGMNICRLELEDGPFSLVLSKEHTPAQPQHREEPIRRREPELPLMPKPEAEAAGELAPVLPETPTAPGAGDEAVTAPVVGVFYSASTPGAAPFIQVGDRVQKGQTLCIVEAMKMMNEITAPAPGVITEVLAANGTQVEYDQPLFRISTSANA